MHTKLPWETDGTIDGFTKVCVGPDKEPIGWVDFEDKDDLAYALMAANQHARLVEALKFYMSICGNTCNSVSRETAQEMYAMGRAALDACEVV